VKGYVWPDPGSSALYLSTTDTVWSLSDDGAAASLSWSDSTTVTGPSVPLFAVGSSYLYAGSTDGRLYQFDLSGAPDVGSVQLGDGGGAVGSPALDVLNSLLYVGTESGAVYALTAPVP
jgi:outer membrane protein assembly factor BamB